MHQKHWSPREKEFAVATPLDLLAGRTATFSEKPSVSKIQELVPSLQGASRVRRSRYRLSRDVIISWIVTAAVADRSSLLSLLHLTV